MSVSKSMSVAVVIKEIDVTIKFEAGCTVMDILNDLRTNFKCFGGCLVPMNEDEEEENNLCPKRKEKTDSLQIHIDMVLLRGVYQFIDYSEGDFDTSEAKRCGPDVSAECDSGWSLNPFEWCFALDETSSVDNKSTDTTSSAETTEDDLHRTDSIRQGTSQEVTARTNQQSTEDDLCGLHILFEACASDPLWHKRGDIKEDTSSAEEKDDLSDTSTSTNSTPKRKSPDSPCPGAKRAATDAPLRVRFADELVSDEQYLDYSLSPWEKLHCFYTTFEENMFRREHWFEVVKAQAMNRTWAQYMDVDVK